MILIQTRQLTKSYGANQVLSGVDFQIQSGERIGLIGRNGCGKTTLMKILQREIAPDEGDLFFAKDLQCSYLRQIMTRDESDQPLFEYCMEPFSHLEKLWLEIQELSHQLSNSPYDEELLHRLGEKQLRFEQENGYATESYVRGILQGLGFSPEEQSKPLSLLSGGERTRVELARTLLRETDLLLLDEPTNHLDIQAIDWLEKFLQNYRGAVLIITHDREFLDRFVQTIYELEGGVGDWYPGNYSHYLAEKRLRFERKQEEYERSEKKRALEEEKLRMFRQWSQRNQKFSARAKDREKKLERMERVERPLWLQQRMKLHLKTRRQSGHDILNVTNLSKSFGEKDLFHNVSFSLFRGERLGIIGANGTGKTTLLKILQGSLSADQGEIIEGTGLEVGYYDQTQYFEKESRNLIEEINEILPAETQGEIRQLLASFLFTGDDVFQTIRSLSGGERARLSLLKLMLQKKNLLLLDEPTNHLDLPSRETLEASLSQYPGTLIFISHDRYFLNQISTHLLELREDGWSFFHGNYESWQHRKEELQVEEPVLPAKVRPVKKKKEKILSAKPPENLELSLLIEEEKLRALELALCEPTIYNDGESLAHNSRLLQEQQRLLEELYERWDKEIKEKEDV